MASTIYSRLAAMVIIMLATCLHITANPKEILQNKYNKKRPLIIVADWNLPPYEFRDNNGKPIGYSVELMETMLKRMGLPYKYIMKDPETVTEMFKNGQADIYISPMPVEGKGIFMGSKVIASYKVRIAYKKGTKPVTMLEQLDDTTKILCSNNRYSAKQALLHGIKSSNLIAGTARQGLKKLEGGVARYLLWGEEPLKYSIKESNMEDIITSPINIPTSEIKFTAHDKLLIDQLDDLFARMEDAGEVHKLRNKWFHPEIKEQTTSYWWIVAIACFVMIIITIVILNRYMSVRIKKRLLYIDERKQIMMEALSMSNHSVISYDIKKNMVYNIHGNFINDKFITRDMFMSKIALDDRLMVKTMIKQLTDGDIETADFTFKWNIGTDKKPEWRHMSIQAIIEKDHNGEPLNIISSITDITQELEEEQHNAELTEKYGEIFEHSTMGLSLFDNNEKLIASNDEMRRIMKYADKQDEYYDNTRLKDIIMLDYHDEQYKTSDMFFCSKIDNPKRNLSIYAEVRLHPIMNSNGDLVFILLSVRNINEERKLHLQREKTDSMIKQANKQIRQYESELNYMMTQNEMRVWRVSEESDKIKFYTDLSNFDISHTCEEFIERTEGENNKEIARKLISTESSESEGLTVILPIKDLSDEEDRIHWYSINRIPLNSTTGHKQGFGLIRDITPLIDVQENLKKETERANLSEQQKSVFLANMTHEIRTPLNAIVGFCDLLQTIDSPDDKKEFARIIRNNCNMLLHLINDILAASTITESGLSINPRETDFAHLFNDICTMLSQQVANPDAVKFIQENPYKCLMTVVDPDRIEQVINNFTTNAIKHTLQGHIKVGYRVENGGIYIYCEDTGRGIPKEKCDDVFKRFVKLDDFVQGTGIGLSICKAIADAYNGKIGVESDEGQGAKFWFWFPCDVKQDN